MRKKWYSVLVTSDATQHCYMAVKAKNRAEAGELALNDADLCGDWALDEDNERDPYLCDGLNCVEECDPPAKVTKAKPNTPTNFRTFVEDIQQDLKNLGFDNDDSIDGGDCCEYLGKLFEDIGAVLKRAGAADFTVPLTEEA